MNTMPLQYMGPRDLLAELLSAYGYDRAPRPTDKEAKRASAELPSDPDEKIALFQREIKEAGPTLRLLVGRRRTLRPGTPPPQSRERGPWRAIIYKWNETIYEKQWLDIPPLCDCCGVPVFRRASERIAGGNRELSTVCSNACQRRRKLQRYKAKYAK